MSDANFENLVEVCRAATFVPGGREASLTLATQELLDALSACLADDREYGVLMADGDPDQLVLGSTVQLIIGDPRTGFGVVADSLQDLIASPKFRVSEPRNYFLIDQKFSKSDAAIPDNVACYRRVLQFVSLLRKSAAYLDVDAGTLVFVHGGKYELPVNYSVDDLIRLDGATLDKLVSFVGDDTHNEQKLAIVEESVRSIAGAYERSARFTGMLSQLSDLSSKINDGYRLFVASFSYDKVRDALEAAKVDYAAKIHKVFSDIQNQILGIPVATIVVATQMKAADKIGYEFWVNSAVLIGCWVFVMLMAFLLMNQLHTLGVLATEIHRQRDQISMQYKDIADRFKDVFEFLGRRLRLQKFALGAVGGVLIVGFLLAHVVYFKLTVPAETWLKSLLSCYFSA
ncbi:hypothetical protein KDW98_24955 [Burkholderia vietnamiensis]|uniref:hypothetical protein n=1 Tax=Burkholderia vietnamiensis TaxID=60552 RepID=UPI00158EE1F0|nr:hypothetical protein [Burkholderia vietnamiensis]MBR8164420.1 hypothetical protein [Burkholderia vietnamiensis]MCA8149828.1 hypothetical protein [Burkholderia vietnamiensis]